ncbi:MAG: hypothetical protein AAGG57_16005 [Pseudomonadota bacterium]
MLALCYGGVGDALLVRIENGAGHGDAFGTDLDAPIGELVGVDV